MIASIEVVLWVLFVLSGIFIVGYLFSTSMLLSRLEQGHPEVFKELGSPSLAANNTISSANRVIRFLLRKDYLAIAEPSVVKLAGITRVLFVASVVMFVGTIAVYLMQEAG
jgi:hypothetical protein